MTNKSSSFTARLFYSYCHRDKQHKTDMEKSLSHLRRSGALAEWSDREILPGQKISERIRKEMGRADIFVFLLSQNFIASDECMKEWNYAKQSPPTSKPVFRIPIILADCAWRDLLESDDVKALPDDGKPVDQFDNTDTPWQQVYEGLKKVIDQLRENFTPRQEFLDEIEETGFSSQKNIRLKDIFIFPTLKYYPPQTKSIELVEEEITSESQLLNKKHVLIHGEEMSGKTALSRHLFLFLCNKSNAVLLVDLNQATGKPHEKALIQAYQEQFHGDYSLWSQNPNKTIIVDNLSPNTLDFVIFVKQFFSNIIIMSSSDSFYSFFKDERRLSDFHEMGIIEEIVEAIADGGLRLVNWILKDEDEIRELADYIRHKYHDYDAQKIENALRWISFVWTMVNIESVVGAINTPEIREAVSRVVRRKGTPAYDLVGYFSHLDSASELTKESKRQLEQLLKKHDDPFVRNVLSIRTQHYMNTHKSKAMIEQSICSLLNIKYAYRHNLLR